MTSADFAEIYAYAAGGGLVGFEICLAPDQRDGREGGYVYVVHCQCDGPDDHVGQLAEIDGATVETMKEAVQILWLRMRPEAQTFEAASTRIRH